jgi:hypothetical protein
VLGFCSRRTIKCVVGERFEEGQWVEEKYEGRVCCWGMVWGMVWGKDEEGMEKGWRQ